MFKPDEISRIKMRIETITPENLSEHESFLHRLIDKVRAYETKIDDEGGISKSGTFLDQTVQCVGALRGSLEELEQNPSPDVIKRLVDLLDIFPN